MNTTTASHAFFLLFVMAIAVVIDSTSATKHADGRRRTKSFKGSKPRKVCLNVYDIQGSTDLVSGGYQYNNVCGYPDRALMGTEKEYNECLELAGVRAEPFVFNRPRESDDPEFQFVTGEQYSPCGFNDSAFKGIDPQNRLEYQAHEFYNRDVASIRSIEYDFYCEGGLGVENCYTQLSIITREDSNTALGEGDYDCLLQFRTEDLITRGWNKISIDHDTVAYQVDGDNCPTGTTTLGELAEAEYVYGTYGTETVGDQQIAFRWIMRGGDDIGYYDNIRIQVEDEECVRVYDM